MFYGLSANFARPVVRFLSIVLMVGVITPAQSEQPASPTAGGPIAFPEVDDTEPLAADGSGAQPLLSPSDAAARLELPTGFAASVFAAEPSIRNPIDLAWDSSGRLYVAENYTYAMRGVKFREDLRDRVVVLTDQDQDGQVDDRHVLIDTVANLTSVEVGPQGVWLMCPPQLLFIPDTDHDAIADAPPRVILDGFTVADQNYHNFANGLRFGPDGWLYGRCGGSCPGQIGKPSSPAQQRVTLEGGIWRYHVGREQFEVLCHGTTNPWGHDFNRFGELFFINTVIGHLWHGIHGAHFKRPFTLDPNPDVYELIDQHADHYHFDTGQNWTDSRDGAANDFGGGHAHTGMMIYQETAWPQEFRGDLYTCNFHGRRANREHLHREGTGYVGKHAEDFFVSDDAWFRGMELTAGPDGNVFLADWSDLGECHEHTGVHRNSGRIYKISYSPTNSNDHSADQVALADASTLAQNQLHEDRWVRHQSRLRLMQMAGDGHDLDAVVQWLTSQLKKANTPETKLRLFWTLDAIGAADTNIVNQLLQDDSPMVVCAAIRSVTQFWPIDDCFGPNAQCRTSWPAIRDEANAFVQRWNAPASAGGVSLAAPAVRLAIASTLQRLPGDLRATAADKLLAACTDDDIGDHNLGHMIWYGLMSRASKHADELIPVLDASNLPTLDRLIARSLSEQADHHHHTFASLFDLLSNRLGGEMLPKDQLWCDEVLTGMTAGLVGVSQCPRPASYEQVNNRFSHASKPEIVALRDKHRDLLDKLQQLFGEGLPPEELIRVIEDRQSSQETKLTALLGLIRLREQVPAETIIRLAQPLLRDTKVNLRTARGLATMDAPEVADQLIENYRRFRAYRRAEVMSLLCSRLSFARRMVEALQNGKFQARDLSASQVRVLLAHQDDKLTDTIQSIWGRLNESTQAQQAEIARLKQFLSSDRLAAADLTAGGVLYQKTCQACHELFGTGGKVGPVLTGAQRSSLDYLLSNIVAPSEVVGADYRATQILTVDGQLLVGLVTQRTRNSLTLVSATQTWTLPLADIEEEQVTNQSPMPTGLLTNLSDQEIVNLIGYLSSPTDPLR